MIRAYFVCLTCLVLALGNVPAQEPSRPKGQPPALFQVTAIDSCPESIEVASQNQPSEEELALCVPIWDPCVEMAHCLELVEDPADSRGA
jgi:hypothetical protein